MRLIDCAHEAGIPAPLAAELAGMVSPTVPWVCTPLEGGNNGLLGGAAVTTSTVAGGGGGGGGITAILQDGGGVSAYRNGDGDGNGDGGGGGGGGGIVSLLPPEEEIAGWDRGLLEDAGLSIDVAEGADGKVPGHIQRQLSVRRGWGTSGGRRRGKRRGEGRGGGVRGGARGGGFGERQVLVVWVGCWGRGEGGGWLYEDAAHTMYMYM